jgi:hypothetical protein
LGELHFTVPRAQPRGRRRRLGGGDIATENARLGATGPIDLLDTESAIAVRDDLAAPNAQLLDRSVSLFKALGGGLAAEGEVSEVRPPTPETPHREVALSPPQGRARES